MQSLSLYSPEKLHWYARQLFRHRNVLVRCLLMTIHVRLKLTLFSYKSVMLRINKARSKPPIYASIPPLLVVWCVKQASRIIPYASCLTQALTIKHYLARMGDDCTVKIGVRTELSGAFFAHAWVLYQGDLLWGGDEDDLARFSVLTEL